MGAADTVERVAKPWGRDFLRNKATFLETLR
jgi:hypothetical protein